MNWPEYFPFCQQIIFIYIHRLYVVNKQQEEKKLYCTQFENLHTESEKEIKLNSSANSANARFTGCRVGSRIYEEGEMVRDIEWKAACDNCFCAMGAVRCVPLACAPPLQGCSPIVREGHCCPSTYNCSESQCLCIRVAAISPRPDCVFRFRGRLLLPCSLINCADQFTDFVDLYKRRKS